MRIARTLFIVFVTLLVTTLGVGASDVWQGASNSLLAQLLGKDQPTGCPSGMSPLATSLTFSCIDTYEASPGNACVVRDVTSAEGTMGNIADTACVPVSVVGSIPWRFITRAEAMTACAKAGKRLPTALEWYHASLGTNAATCNIQGGTVFATGAKNACRAASGIYDSVGNLWEWVSDDVMQGAYQNRPLPKSGYVVQVDTGGVATVTSEQSASSTSGYLWSEREGAFGMLRGGFYASASDADVVTLQAATTPNFSGAAIGFRCVQ
jgi:hypothetical protein